MIVLRVGMPQFWCLPVDSAHQAAHHGPRRLLDFSQTKICDLRSALGGDKDVRRFAIPVDDGRLS